MFSSWSWAGWEGTAFLPREILNVCEDNTDSGVDLDLELSIISVSNSELSIEGWVVDLHIRTEPFSEVFVSEQKDSIASVKEGRSLHNNTIRTGHHRFVVIQRQCGRDLGRVTPRQKVFLLVLDMLDDGLAQRRTLITVTLFTGCDFMQTEPRRRQVKFV